ncbi:PadR family transcriptional regulator [Bounagaea algeriensis]
MLELAVLGLLQRAPMHGYELRKRLRETLGVFRTLSYGTLYPTLRRMLRHGLIADESDAASRGWGRRGRRAYYLTEHGRQRFTELVGSCGPQACDDTMFGVHVAFFAQTPAEVRLHILQARRHRLQQRGDALRTALSCCEDDCGYLRQLHRLRLDHSEQEVRWLDAVIEREQERTATGTPAAAEQQRGNDT